MVRLRFIGQYWSARHREVRLLGAGEMSLDEGGGIRGTAHDLTQALPFPRHRRRFRDANRKTPWREIEWTYSRLPLPSLELIELLESSGRPVAEWAEEGIEPASLESPELSLEDLDREPSPEEDHLVAPIVPRRALAFGVTYLNSALERETEGERRDYSYVYRAVKDRGERPELFLKGTSPEHFVGPNGRMGLRRDLTNSVTLSGHPCDRRTVSCGIEPER